MHDLKVGDQVIVKRIGYYKGEPRTNTTYYGVGEVAYITRLGTDDPEKFFSKTQQEDHVAINRTMTPRVGSWIDVNSLEKYDPTKEADDLQAALQSISEAARHQEHTLMFKSITIADSAGNDLKITLNGGKIRLSNEYDETHFEIDVDSWMNLQEAVEMALRQIDPDHKGKEKK